MINQLVAALGQELGLTSKEIADVVWLALQMQTPESALTGVEKAKNEEDALASTQIQPTDPKTSDLFSERDKAKDAQSSQSPKAELHIPDSQMDGQGGFGSGLPLKVPDARSLREPLSLARSLKPFLQKVTAGLSTELDEAATVERIAEEGVWLPVLKPALEPWLDLALVVDESLSMQLWHQTIAELQRLLSHYGVFRDVRVWSLVTDDQGQIALRPRVGTASRRKTAHRPKELIDPSGRRLILVATDCVDAIWQHDSMLPALKLWAENGPMAIMQMLPEWLWARTGLGFASAVKLHSLMPGAPNQQLNVRDLSPWDEVDLELGIRVPVVTLEPESFLAWSKLVSAKGVAWSPGFVFEPERMTALDGTSQQTSLGEATPEQRLQQFRSTASPMARRLAGLLAAAPVINLPIVRIIQDRLLPQSRQVHVAEVFLGGLLKPLSENQANLNPSLAPFDFLNGVRDLILESLPTDDSVNVIGEVSQFVADRLGLSLDAFSVLLKNPQQTSDRKLTSQTRPFALVTASILKNLGGNYSDIASEIEYANQLAIQQNSNSTFRKTTVGFQVGGSLRSDNALYVFRKADSELYESLKQGVFCYVLGSLQVGKSSLRVRTTQRLQAEGIACGTIDIAAIGSHGITPEQWYLGGMRRLARSLGLKVKVLPWWNEHSGLSPVQRLGEFLENVVLAELAQPIVIFIDEIDAILQVDFKDDFFALLHTCYSQRNNKPVFQRLNFVVLGVATHLDLIQDQRRSPFNIGKSIHLRGFTLAEAQILSDGLIEVAHDPQAVLREILHWTGGHPFLTQSVCTLINDLDSNIPLGSERRLVEEVIREKIIEDWKAQDCSYHLEAVQQIFLCKSSDYKERIKALTIYENILLSVKVIATGRAEESALILSGLIVEKNGQLEIANRIYQEVFNQSWVSHLIGQHERKNVDDIILFISYSNRDKSLRDKLVDHLSILAKQGIISTWYDRQLNHGSELDTQADYRIEQAQIILLLVSAQFLASDYCYGIELSRAMERHESGDVVVIPLILRPCLWEESSFGQLQVLPRNGRSITDFIDRDKAFADIAMEIRSVALSIRDSANDQNSRITTRLKPGDNLAVGLEIPRGQVPLTSIFYIERPPVEERCRESILKPGSMICIKGPRQVGKTSLMSRILNHAVEADYKTVALDFQLADESIFSELDSFLRWFCTRIATDLKLPNCLDDYWHPSFGSKSSCNNYFEEYLLRSIDQPFVLALDEVDRVFKNKKIASDFLGLLRAWHEMSKVRGDWEKLRLIVVYSTAVYTLTDLNQSPFNVGLLIELPDFTGEQVLDLAKRYGLNWRTKEVKKLMAMIGGHPYLIREALHHITYQDLTLDELLATSFTEEGIYSDHLRAYWWILSENSELLEATRSMVSSNQPIRLEPVHASSLNSLGLIKFKGSSATMSNNLYRLYFQECFDIS